MPTCGGHDQVGYTEILSIQIAYEHGSRYFLDLGVPAFPQATALREDPKYRHRQLGEVVWRYGMVGSLGPGLWGLCQAAVAVSVTWFRVVNRSAISRRYSSASSRWRPGRKYGDIPLKADKNRWACPSEANRFMARSRWRVD